MIAYSQTLEEGLLIYYSWDSTHLGQSDNGFDPSFFNTNFTEDRHGNSSSAIYFNGIDNYIDLPDSYSLQPPFPLSFALWFKLDDLDPQNTVIFHNNFNEYTASGVWMNVGSSERLAINFGNGEGFYPSARKTFYTDVHLEADKWYFATGVINTRFDMRIFINGEEQTGFLDGTAEDIIYVEGSGNIGRIDANYQLDPYYFKGYMDEFRYWNRRLLNDEMRLLYEEETLFVNEVDCNSIKISPNPTYDFFYITTNLADIFSIRLIDQFGRLHFIAVDSRKIDLSTFPKGMYILQIKTSEGKQYNEKIIKR